LDAVNSRKYKLWLLLGWEVGTQTTYNLCNKFWIDEMLELQLSPVGEKKQGF
jgi:hypothetical protein